MTDNTDIGTASTLPVRIDIPGYRIRRQVGSDSIGLWFDAEQISLQRKLTLKVLKPKYETHAGARQTFLEEMDRLAGLDHPSLSRLIDARRDDPLTLVVERIGADSLATRLRDGKPLAEGVAVSVLLDAARAMEFLVEKGFAHKNLSPQSLTMRESGGCRVVTMRNIVTLEELAALRGKLAQDPHYIAPEQLAGSAPISGAAHVYHIGCLLFHAFAGYPPFGSITNAVDIAKSHLQSEFPSLRQVQPFLRRAIPDLIDACTQRAPEARPQLSDLVAALELLVEGKDPGIKPGSTDLDEQEEGGIVAPKPRKRRRRRY